MHRWFGTGSPIRASKACLRRCTRCSAETASACRAAVEKGTKNMSLATISPQRAADFLKAGAILVDIREQDEHAREHIADAHHLPLSRLEAAELALHEGHPVIFHCRSGGRTAANAGRLAVRAGDCE